MSKLDDFTIRQAELSDLDAIAALDRDCFDVDERWSWDSWREEVAYCVEDATARPAGGAVIAAFMSGRAVDDKRLVVVASVGDEIASAACFHLAGDSAELYRVMTAPAWRGRGLATLLLARGFEWASQRGAVDMLLEVRVDNGAQALYVDAGFVPFYQRTNYYGPGRDAVMMRKSLEGANNG